MRKPLTINFVGTRCTDGNHLALERWYADHVHLLLMAPELQQAELFACQQVLAGKPPEYFCLYEFASHDDFLQFEHGQPKALATELTNAAAGRSSIEIVQRTQYMRWLHRQWPAASRPQGKAWRLAACVASESEWNLEAQRWLADLLQGLRSMFELRAAQVFVQHGHANQALILLDFSEQQAIEIWPDFVYLLAQPSLYGVAQTLQMQWATSARAVQSWLR
jgi:hypothetical protein